MCSRHLKFSREKRVIFNNFRYSVRFLDSYEMLVYIIDTLSNSNEYNTMLPVKNRFPNCDFRGGQISQPLVLWLIWVLASTLDPSASEINKALSVTYKLLFILSKNIVPSRSYRYIRDRAFPVTRLPPPIYTKFDVKQRYIWVLASTLAHSASEINKALSVTYKLLFILWKNIVPSRSYRYIRDRAFPVTACHPLYIQSLM